MPAKAAAAKAPAAKPAKEAAKPAKEAAKPAKETAKPAKETAKPAKPAKEAAKPAKETAKPAKEAAKPAKEAAKGKSKESTVPKATAPKAAAQKATAPKATAPKAAAPKAAAPKAAAPKKETKVSTGLYVKNWGRSGVAAAQALFSGFGKVTSVRLRRGKYCQVWFDSAVTAKKAIDTVKKDRRGRDLQLVAAKSQPKPDRRENTRVVCAKPIYRRSVTRKELLSYFGETGKVVKLRTYVNGTAYVYYDTSAAAAKAIAEKDGKAYMGHTLKVVPSVRSLETDKKKEAGRRTLIELNRWVKAQRAS